MCVVLLCVDSANVQHQQFDLLYVLVLICCACMAAIRQLYLCVELRKLLSNLVYQNFQPK